MTTLLGQNGVRRHGRLRFWPENGLIKIEDSRDGSYTAISVKDALLRAQALNDMIHNSLDRSRTKDSAFYADEISGIQQLVEDVIDVCRIAKEQGEPTNPDVVREKIDRRVRPVSGISLEKTSKQITPSATALKDFEW